VEKLLREEEERNEHGQKDNGQALRSGLRIRVSGEAENLNNGKEPDFRT
jgi:hypothetical protein